MFIIFGKFMGLSMIKNCFIFILAPIIFLQYDWADALARTMDYWHPNFVNSPSLPPYKDVISGGAPAPAANVPPSPPYCVYPPPAKPAALPAPLPLVASAPGASPPAEPPPSIAPGSSQSAPLFQPPVAFPAPPPGHARAGLWCVANPAAASAVVQAAMDYACGSGADCGMAAPGGPCYLPDTLMAHASYAFNSCWQRTRVAGGTCDFGGAAMLITRDPSYDGCQYIYM